MFNKKIISFVATFALTLCAVFASGQVLFAKASTLDAQDEYFLQFVREDTGLEQVDFVSTQLYDQTLALNGRQYVFTVGGVQGYALTSKIIIGDQAFYEIEELFYNKPAPFSNYQGIPVYITFDVYLDYVNGVFYNLADNRSVVSPQIVEELAYRSFGYRMVGDLEYVDTSEVINYNTRTVESYNFPYEAPDLCGSVNGSCCANTAGAVVIGYYDRFFENLIPNFQSYISFAGSIRYKSTGIDLSNLVETMRDYMSVDGIQYGTTFTGFQQGMENYVEEKGYTYTSTSVMSWGELNYSTYKSYVSQEIPVALFLNGFNMVNAIREESNMDTVSSSYCASTHVEVGIGYKTYTYYNADGGVITTRNYLYVVSGLFEYGIGYLNINGNGEIVNAIAIEID